jgi:hypothetical protein
MHTAKNQTLKYLIVTDFKVKALMESKALKLYLGIINMNLFGHSAGIEPQIVKNIILLNYTTVVVLLVPEIM